MANQDTQTLITQSPAAGSSNNQQADLLQADLLLEAAKRFMDGPANDNLDPNEPGKAYDEPFFGFVRGADPIWQTFKQTVAKAHWTPLEAFLKAYPTSKAVSEELSVAVVVCPQTKATIADQKKAKGFPSKRWLISRLAHDRIIGKLCSHLAGYLNSRGLEAMVPDHLEGFSSFPDPTYQISSYWSHRHAAFAAGLGTFGLCDGLITKVGKAHRLGSIIVRHPFPPTPRPYTDAYEYCLFHNSNTCGLCIKRCPVKALSPQGHDKSLCRDFLYQTVQPSVSKQWPELDGAYGCGLCQSSVPCDTSIPPTKASKKLKPQTTPL
jgi:epoxyqueuosine reductase QueG